MRKVDLESAKQDYAFDNPYFEDDEKAVKTATDGPQRDTIISVKGINYLSSLTTCQPLTTIFEL